MTVQTFSQILLLLFYYFLLLFSSKTCSATGLRAILRDGIGHPDHGAVKYF